MDLQIHQTWVIRSTDGGLTFDRGERYKQLSQFGGQVIKEIIA